MAYWDNCDHEWEVPIDPIAENEVRCKKCGVPGDRNPLTGEVYWPAT